MKVNRLDVVICFIVAGCVKKLQEIFCSRSQYIFVMGNNHKGLKTHTVVIILFVGVIASVQGLGAGLYTQEDVLYPINGMGHPLILHDEIPDVERSSPSNKEIKPLSRTVQHSNDPSYEYMAHSPYYKAYFKEKTMKMVFGHSWIELEVQQHNLGENLNTKSVVQGTSLAVFDVFESVDLLYKADTSVLREGITVRTPQDIDRIVFLISWDGIHPEYLDDGSILFSDDEKEIVRMLAPFMEDAEGNVCTDIHYELIETKQGHELHKVIDKKGIDWLKKAVYPVVIDPSMQTFEDAWESSGLTPFGQYFKNVNEYVNPANGHVTVTQTDLVIPGRGLDLVISRMYETPAVFYQAEPYEYEAPPVNIGKGWQLDFPYIGNTYIHLWGGSIYNLEWSGNTFENHEGTHFILVKNGDNTYTLTTASGVVYEFSTAGYITNIKDADLNTITFNYDGTVLTSITDTIGRIITFSYASGKLQKIMYNSAELEYGYNGGCLTWMEDFLDRRTTYSYNTGWTEWTEYSSGYFQKSNVYLLSTVIYPTDGYTTYNYDRFSYEDIYGDDGTCLDYYKYYITDQKVYEVNQVRHTGYSYDGNFSSIYSCTATVKNGSDITKGSYITYMNNGVINQKITKNASGTPLQEYTYVYNTRKELVQEHVYRDGSTFSYTIYYAYDNWGNCIYVKDAEGHEQFFSYANTETAGFFIDNTGTIIRKFTSAFFKGTVPASVHTVLLGKAEKQDTTYVKETYITYDSEAHPVQSDNVFGNYTTYLTFSGTFNETGSTNFPIDVTGHTVTGNAILQITGLPSTDTYQEIHSYGCPCNPTIKCTWSSGNWSSKYYSVHWSYCAGIPPDCDDGWASVGPFTHYPGTLGYQSYTTPLLGGKSHTFTVSTNWKAYPAHVQYNIDNSDWETLTSNLQDQTITVPVTITGGSHTLYFSEISPQNTRFTWNLYVPVDNTPDVYTTELQYDTYGNVISVTDPESNTVTFTYSSGYLHAYLTEISAYTGTDTITTKATYDYDRGWMTSLQQPKGVEAGSGYDYLYTYDLLGRITKKEFPLLPGQSERSYIEAVYDDTNKTVTIINQLRHYFVQEYNKLGQKISTNWYTGQYGSGTLYAAQTLTYRYDGLLSTVTDPGNDTVTYTYDFLGRYTQITYPGSDSVFYSYDDTNNKITFTNGRSYHTMYWYDWLSRLTKVEEEYAPDLFAVTTYEYDESGHITSVTDAETHTTTYEYSSLFGLTKTTYPDSTYEQYHYNNVGTVSMFTDANGNETVFTYDDIYRLIHVQYQDQSTVAFTYDLNSNRIQMDDNAPYTGDYEQYTYDCWDRLTSKTRYISQLTYTISYQYDEASRLTILTYPDNMQVLYSYDDLNRITEIKRYVDGVNDEVLINVQHDTENLITQVDYGNDLQATFTYDSRDRLSTLDIKNGATSYLNLDYTYDNNSNITQLVNGWRDTSDSWHSETESYSYDGLDRLISAHCIFWSHVFSYDKVGNRTSKDSVSYTINAVNEVTTLSDGTTFTYDSNGNRIQRTEGTDTWVYTYGYGNRLTRIEKNDIILAEYVYDGSGKRIQVTETGGTTTYLYRGYDVLYEENTTGEAAYVYSPLGKVAKRTTIDGESNTFFYHSDRLGSTRLVTDQDKNIVSAATYHPFGEPSTGEGSEPYLYTGKEKDSSGLYYYGARYYDPEIGRFITRDQKSGGISIPQTLNRYTYCINNPLRYIDTDGNDYFDPDWADEWYEEDNDMGFSLKGAVKTFCLWFQKTVTKWMTVYGRWATNNEDADAYATTIGSGAGGFAAGIMTCPEFGAIGGIAIGVVLYEFSKSAQFYYELWNNDPQFVALYTAAEMYATLLMMGCDCEQEATDAFVELQVYMLQQKYGDEWQEHCKPSVLYYYSEMMKRQQQSSLSGDAPDVEHLPPPGTEAI